MAINARRINRADTGTRDRCHREAPVFAIGREQLYSVAYACMKQVFGETRTDDDRAGVISKVIVLPADQLLENIGRLRVQTRSDSVQVDGGMLKSRARGQRAAQYRRTGNHIRELSADAHDFVRVGDAFKILSPSHLAVGTFRRNHERLVKRTEARLHDQGAVAADGGINEVASKTLSLRLRADKNRNAENYTAKAQQQCPFAMRQKPHRNIERRGHGAVGGGGELTAR